MKRRSIFTLLTVGCVSWLALAQPDAPPLLQTSGSASTSLNSPYAISLEVIVENRGKGPSKDGMVEVTMKPQGAMGSRPKSSVPTMFDPLTDSQPLPALQPGEKKSFTFKTPYYCNSSFKNVRGSFKTSNIDPTGSDVSVGLTIRTR